RTLPLTRLGQQPKLVGVLQKPCTVALGLGSERALLPASGELPHAPYSPIPLLGHLDVSLDPRLGVIERLQRVTVDGAEVSREHLAAGGPHLEAEVEVIAVELAQGLI